VSFSLSEREGHYFIIMNIAQRLKQYLSSYKEKEETAGTDRCFWQVDIHSHLLPGVDDGAASIEETLDGLQQLIQLGINKAIITPHVSQDWFPNDSATLLNGKQLVQDLITQYKLPITIEVAAEYLLDDFFPKRLADNDLLTFGAERYLLFETGWAVAPYQLASVLFQMQTQGYTPILAHPERYKYYHGQPQLLAKLREAGCLFQLNWFSLTGRYGSQVQKQAEWLLEQHWIDFVGSDLHRPNDLKNMPAFFKSNGYKLLNSQPLRNATLL